MTFAQVLGTMFGSWFFYVQSRMLIMAVGLKGGIDAARANYEIDNDRARMIDEDVAIEFLKRAIKMDVDSQFATYGIRFYTLVHWAALLGGHGVAILMRCGWTHQRIETKLQRIVDAETERRAIPKSAL